jgi:hypothetical protein
MHAAPGEKFLIFNVLKLMDGKPGAWELSDDMIDRFAHEL